MNRSSITRPTAKLRNRLKSFLRVALPLAILLGVFLYGGIARATSPESLETNGDTLRATLKNGLRVVIVPNSLAPVATTVVNYLVGSNDVPPDFPGTAHAQEHMMFRGSPGLTADQLAAVTAALGGMFNADTQQTVTQYFSTVPAKDLETALHVEALRMRGVIDSDAGWNQERGAIEQEVAQDLSSPEYVFYSRLVAALFKGTPYAHTPLGTKASFDQTTGTMLREFYQAWYAPNNAVLVITGDVKPEEVLTQVKRLFDRIPAKEIPARRPSRLEPVKPQTLRLATDRSDGLAVIAFRMPGYTSPDFAATRVLADLLDSKRGRLYTLVTQGKALSAEFSLNAMPEASIGYAAAAFPKGAQGDALLEQLWDEDQGTAVRRIDDGSGAVGPAACHHRRRNAEIIGPRSGDELVPGIGRGRASIPPARPECHPVRHGKRCGCRCQRIPRSPLGRPRRFDAEAVRRTLGRKFFTPCGILRTATDKRRSAAGLGGDLPGAVEDAGFSLQPKDRVLPNGIRLIVQPESVSRIVSIYGHVHNIEALTEPQGREGVDQVLDELFSYGTTTMDRIHFQKALDDIGASESAGTDFSLVVLKDHLEQGVKLLADNVLHPALPQNAFATVREQISAAVAGELQSPNYLFRRSLRKALFPADDPTLRQATPASVRSLILPDVRDYYATVFRPDLTTVVVIGPITFPEAEALISKYFGQWQANGPRPRIALPPVPLNQTDTIYVPNDERIQDKVALSETLGLNRSSPDYYALQLGNHVLGGGFYATRLYRDLREKNGLVYFVSSSFDIDRTRGIYLVHYACDPVNVSKTQQIVQQNLEQMRVEPVSATELRQAQAMLLKEIPLAESSIDLIAEGLISRVELGLPLQEPLLAAQHYLALTAEQVRAAFAKHLRPEDLVRVTEGPKPE